MKTTGEIPNLFRIAEEILKNIAASVPNRQVVACCEEKWKGGEDEVYYNYWISCPQMGGHSMLMLKDILKISLEAAICEDEQLLDDKAVYVTQQRNLPTKTYFMIKIKDRMLTDEDCQFAIAHLAEVEQRLWKKVSYDPARKAVVIQKFPLHDEDLQNSWVYRFLNGGIGIQAHDFPQQMEFGGEMVSKIVLMALSSDPRRVRVPETEKAR